MVYTFKKIWTMSLMAYYLMKYNNNTIKCTQKTCDDTTGC